MMNEHKGFLHRWQNVTAILVLYDLLAVIFSYFVALWVRFDCHFSKIPEVYFSGYYRSILIYAVICILVFRCFCLYRSIWQFASFVELSRLILANIVTLFIYVVFANIISSRMPVTYFLFGITLQFIATVGVRFSYRFVLLLRANHSSSGAKEQEKVLLIGAGQAGQSILRDIRRSREVNEEVACIIDDDRNKWNRYIDGVKIVGGRESIVESCEKYHISKIYYAIPSADIKIEKDILNICNETNCQVKKLPGMYQFMTDEVSLADMKPVQIEDLLGRDPIKVNMEEIYDFIKGKVILVTGGGGSIGSELCRQIAAHEPKKLIIFDIYENNAYDIRLELLDKYPQLDLEAIIGSVRDIDKLLDLVETYHPQVIYHAAAHKHVPLMEDSPCESIKNNAFGTYNTALAALASGCERFVLISTDKAVNPTNIMGASKRLCEMIIQTFDKEVKAGNAEKLLQLYPGHLEGKEKAELKGKLRSGRTEFVAVRFGNVLGSNGSVIPVFKKQIQEGGPVTVTHPDIIRYFMTIPEAVSLVLQAGVYAQGGEIFVFDMGEPIKIDTLARNLIKLFGHEPDGDIKIIYTGLRPGEKLYEEKLMAEEGMKKTENKLIHIGKPIPFDSDQFLEEMKKLREAAYENVGDIRERVKAIVGTYEPK